MEVDDFEHLVFSKQGPQTIEEFNRANPDKLLETEASPEGGVWKLYELKGSKRGKIIESGKIGTPNDKFAVIAFWDETEVTKATEIFALAKRLYEVKFEHPDV